MLKKTFGAIAMAATAGACSTVQVAETGETVPERAIVAYDAWPVEFAGRTVEVRTSGGVVNVANLAPDGKLTVIPELSDVAVQGTWGTRGEALCTNVPGVGEECWAYQPVVAANGEWVKLRSTAGKSLSVRLMSAAEEDLIEKGG